MKYRLPNGRQAQTAIGPWLRYVERDRQRKASTITDYRHVLYRSSPLGWARAAG
jgi:hypothetical protein